MTIGQWFGKWVGSWFGTGEERPEGSIAGSASIRITASGTLSADSGPIIVGISGTAVIRISGTAKAKQDDNGEFAAIARVHQSVKVQREYEARIEANRLAQIAADKEQQDLQKAEDERRTLAEERLLAEMVAQGAEMRRRELERSANVLEFKPVIDTRSIERSAEVVTSSVRQTVSVRDASTEAETLDESDDLALILILLEAA